MTPISSTITPFTPGGRDVIAAGKNRGFAPEVIQLPPLHDRPPRLGAQVKWLVAKFFWPKPILWIALGVFSYYVITPSPDRMVDFEFSVLALLYARNVSISIVVIGGLHLWLYRRRAQGTSSKYDLRWLATDRKTFLTNNQTRDNMIWTLGSACAVAAAFEAVMFWFYANDWIPRIGWSDSAPYAAFILFAVFYIEAVQFWAIHRLLHWDPLYKAAHHIHHKNVNTGPWSGVAMHPVEHALYFSLVFVFAVVPASPYLITFVCVYLLVAPSASHSGFDRLELPGGRSVALGDYFHNLHHRYFECNYGVLLFPVDRWTGTFHDGSPESHKKMKARRTARRRG